MRSYEPDYSVRSSLRDINAARKTAGLRPLSTRVLKCKRCGKEYTTNQTNRIWCRVCRIIQIDSDAGTANECTDYKKMA